MTTDPRCVFCGADEWVYTVSTSAGPVDMCESDMDIGVPFIDLVASVFEEPAQPMGSQ